jgi:hypothetical protein
MFLDKLKKILKRMDQSAKITINTFLCKDGAAIDEYRGP